MATGFCAIVILVFVSCADLIHGSAENVTQTNPIQKRFEKSNLGSSRARKYYISNRDSYVDAANSFGSSNSRPVVANRPNQPSSHGMIQAMNSYQVPQSSYGVPDYGMQMQMGGWGPGAYDDDGQSSKGGGGADIAGLIGLIGLKGLKGTIPLIKIALITFITLLPLIVPLLIPLSLLKFGLILLKPVITFSGRGSKSVSEAGQIAEKLSFIENFAAKNGTSSTNSTVWNEEVYNEIITTSMEIGNDILGKDADSQCMERIACEGVLKSLPRIFLRILGDNSYHVSRVTRNIGGVESDGLQRDNVKATTARRKDLATLALNRLKNPQYLTKKPSITDDKTTTEVCRQYKCTNLF
ncbi:hypothetical protein Ocin01_03078 [Orchesella cincta]|uniref:Uncharacterized protein n=1 Tax=Orchesella cincta TaxID=48709 RepID=A0A1D2NF61_ORCCI|nr:hypothetical protein Ocin01_03078 [Orchesella cincta]